MGRNRLHERNGAQKLLPEDWEVYSAGIETHGVNPDAIKAMNEVGIDISHHSSDIIDHRNFKQSNISRNTLWGCS
ncbi:MAG: hypothetical protein ABS938_12640, partial [Psychrobacillus psychrodurans]